MLAEWPRVFGTNISNASGNKLYETVLLIHVVRYPVLSVGLSFYSKSSPTREGSGTRACALVMPT